MVKRIYKRRLKNYLINREVQLTIIITNIAYMVIIIVISMAVLLSPYLEGMFFSDDPEIQYQSAQTFLSLMERLVPAVLLTFLLVFVHQMLLTHRICGPLVNFAHTFRRIAEGDLTRKVVLRKGDYLREESEKINNMISALIVFIGNIRKGNAKLVTILEELLSRIKDPATKVKAEEALDLVKQEALLVKRDLSIFKIENGLAKTMKKNAEENLNK